MSKDPDVVELEWSQPTQTYGDVLGYRIRYGIKNQTLKEEYIPGNRQHTYKITDLGKLESPIYGIPLLVVSFYHFFLMNVTIFHTLVGFNSQRNEGWITSLG